MKKLMVEDVENAVDGVEKTDKGEDGVKVERIRTVVEKSSGMGCLTDVVALILLWVFLDLCGCGIAEGFCRRARECFSGDSVSESVNVDK